MKNFVFIFAVCLLIHSKNVQSQSRLIGDTFEFSAGNFSTSFGTTFDPVLEPRGFDFFDLEILETGGDDWGGSPVTLTFDGIVEEAGNMLVSERVVQWPGVAGGIFAEQAAGIDGETEFDLFDWENDGEVVEFSFQTKDGTWPAGELEDHSFYTLLGLDWANSDDEFPLFYQQGFYFYYSSKGVPTTGYEMQLPQTALLVGKHPFDDSIEEVVYIGYSRGQVEEVTKPYDGGFHLTGGTTQLDDNASLAVLLGAMGLEPTDQDAFHWGFLVTPPDGPSIVFEPGDVDQNSMIDEADINALSEAVRNGVSESRFDVNGDSAVNSADRNEWINVIKFTFVGDANLDGEFNSGDLVKVFEAGKFETGQPAVWSEGDWDGDNAFGSGDFVLAFQAGAFEQGPRLAVANVPEPNSLSLFLLMGLLAIRRR